MTVAIEPNDRPTVFDPSPAADRDPMLAYFLNFMEAFEFSADVTLMVSGLLVSGTPIGVHEFVRLHRSEFESAHVRVGPDSLVSYDDARKLMEVYASVLFQGWEETAPRPPSTKDFESDRDAFFEQLGEYVLNRRDHVMLKNVAVWAPGSPPVELQLWRGRLSDVSAWWQGRHAP